MEGFRNFFVNHLKGLDLRLMANPRRWYHKKKAKDCYRDKCSIIFIFFIENIREFSKSDVFKVDDPNYSYPVGGIKLDGRVIKIGFVHYLTFEEAKCKWIERFARVDFDNMIILWEGKDIGEKELISLNTLKGKKMVISNVNEIFSDKFSFYKGSSLYENWFPGKILEYKNIFGLKRFLDDFDYIRLINEEVNF